MIILGIETSCDETALALYDSNKGLLGHILHSQTTQLIKHGGVIPEVAARSHIQYLSPLLSNLLKQHNLNIKNINVIAYTKGPGLIGSLLTGVTFAKTLGFGLKIPTIGINHLEGHLLACMIKEAYSNNSHPSQPMFPFLALIASGGHTMLVQANDLSNYQILGETLDDAAGEAIDKTAKLLDLTPPNGKELSQLAESSNNHQQFSFTKPLIRKNNLNFSFSGIKTAAMLKINKNSLSLTDKANIACAFQATIMDTLIYKCKLALKITNLKQLIIAGGVSANSYLRTNLLKLCEDDPNIKIFFPKLEFCTDNAAMIACAAFLKIQKNSQCFDLNTDITALARWDLESL